MTTQIDEKLQTYNADDVSIKLLNTLFSIVPFTPDFEFYNSLEGAVNRVGGDLARAQELAGGEDVTDALKIAGYLDTSDKLIAGYAGVKNILSFFSDSTDKKSTFEADPQQALDASLKAAAMSYMIYKLFPGSVKEKIISFKDSKAGKETAVYYALVEIALPFSDNLVDGSGNLVSRMLKSKDTEMADQFKKFIPGQAYDQATQVLSGLTEPLEGYVSQAKDYTEPFAQKVKAWLPAAMNIADSATGLAATGADLLPVWTFLGARLAAESCAIRSIQS